MKKKLIVIALIVCCASFIIYVQTSDAETGGFTVFIDKDFTKITNVTGFQWIPNSEATLEIDNGNNGSVDYTQTITVPDDGTADFDLGGADIPVAEGDWIRMFDDSSDENTHIHYVYYLTLDVINPLSDTLAGRARDGNIINAMVFDVPSIPSGPDLNVVADENDSWNADFSGTIDIDIGSSGWAWIQDDDFDKTQINWTVEEILTSDIDICPDTLNLKSKGKWITGYIELPGGYDVNQIDLSSIELEVGGTSIPVELSQTEIGDYNDNDILDIMVKFDRSLVQDNCTPGAVEMKVFLLTIDGMAFEGFDTVLVLEKGQEHFSDDPNSVVY